jgi:hypothetical protein
VVFNSEEGKALSELLSIARRFIAEMGEKGEKPSAVGPPFSPLSPFSPPSSEPQPDPLLTGAEPWDLDTASRLMFDADSLFEELKINRQVPAIQSAAAMVVSALSTRDMETLRLAVAEFIDVARRIAAMRNVELTPPCDS